MADLEIHMVPKNLYYQEADYVRGLANEIDRLRRVNADLVNALQAIGSLSTEGANGEPETALNLAVRLRGAIQCARKTLRAAGLSDEITEIASAVRLDGTAGKSEGEPRPA